MCKYLYYRCFLENGHAENLQGCVQAGVQIEALFEDGDEQIDRDGDPDLGFDGGLGGAEEAHDAQVLLDPFEEQLDPLAAFLETDDGECGQGKAVGQEGERLTGFAVAEFDAAQPVGTIGCGMDAAGAHALVAPETGCFIDRARRESSEPEVGFGADDEEGGGLGQAIEACDADQAFSEIGVDAPVAFLVGIGQGGARDTPADADMVELAILGAQALAIAHTKSR